MADSTFLDFNFKCGDDVRIRTDELGWFLSRIISIDEEKELISVSGPSFYSEPVETLELPHISVLPRAPFPSEPMPGSSLFSKQVYKAAISCLDFHENSLLASIETVQEMISVLKESVDCSGIRDFELVQIVRGLREDDLDDLESSGLIEDRELRFDFDFNRVLLAFGFDSRIQNIAELSEMVNIACDELNTNGAVINVVIAHFGVYNCRYDMQVCRFCKVPGCDYKSGIVDL
ncbi:MAG: hypothetical protein NUW37_07480 [Planctomycetes bacterium]|nr:hypothetical protein [Planctomycetota bacterium]